MVCINIPIIFLFSVYLKKIADDECPLFLRLCAGPNEKVLSLVLKENETGEVNVSKLLLTVAVCTCSSKLSLSEIIKMFKYAKLF